METPNGLAPALAAVVNDTLTPVPGGAACVPQVPDSLTGFTSARCGNLFEALKWEKRLETAYTGYAQWYLDSRGWGDLPVGTPLEHPVPGDEMATRQRAPYNIDGTSKPGHYGI